MWVTVALVLVWSILPGAPAAADAADTGRRSVVVTTEVLGDVVTQLAGEVADVSVLMSGGADPHSWQPSARDSEAIFGADLIVANGLDLEEGLVSVLEQVAADGIAIFYATDHVAVRGSAGGEEVSPDRVDEAADPSGVDAEARADQDHAVGDPHFWLDPSAMRDVVLALGPVLSVQGIDVESRVDALAAELEALDARIAESLSVVPEAQRQLVTGHGALGYFADHYGFRIVGTVVPGLSSSDEPSAREIAELVDAIRAAGATVLFTDVGTPRSVADAVADEAGARVVELQVAQLPEGGGYAELMLDLASSVAGALVPPDEGAG